MHSCLHHPAYAHPSQFVTYQDEYDYMSHSYCIPSHPDLPANGACTHPTEWQRQEHLHHSQWSSQPAYHSVTPDLTTQPVCYPQTQLPLYAPVPQSSYHPTFPISDSPPYGGYSRSQSTVTSDDVLSQQLPPSLPHIIPEDCCMQQNALDYYSSIPLGTFPTPSELLTVHNGATATDQAETALEPERNNDGRKRIRQHLVSTHVDFQPTDPDSISSHDKKRHYLECLEHYVTYLHDQLRIVGTEPLQLERVSTYRGLSSRSIRTLLVHMEDTVKSLHQQTAAEEQAYLRLRDECVTREINLQSVATVP